MTTVSGEDDVPVCLNACSDTWEEYFFDNLGQEDQSEDQDEEAICHWKIFIFSLNLEVFTRCYASGEFMDNLTAVQIATAKQTTLHDFI